MTQSSQKLVRSLRGRKQKFQYRLQLLGMALTAIGVQLGAIAGFPNRFVIVVLTAGTVMIAIAQFPIKEFIAGKPDARDN
jgi:hypothetical protein